ncbi:MAG TPA: hypothetical protein VKB96_05915 [Gammaproteobacteria bacterium]|nr:hypothetical protein [Gammaproteobacteria bacterium]
MMIRYKHARVEARNKPMTVERAVAHALSPSTSQSAPEFTSDIVGRLLTVLHSKGILLPTELVQVLGAHDYEEARTDNGTTTPTR